MVTCQDSTRSKLPWGLLAPCRRTFGSERHRYAIAWPYKLRTDLMAHGGYKWINRRRRGTREESRKHQIQPEYGYAQADAGRDCRTRLARPNSQARTRTGKYPLFPFSWPRAGLTTLPGWSMLLQYVWPYIHTVTEHTVCIDDKYYSAAEIGRNPVCKHHIPPEFGEWAGWRGMGRSNPSRETKISGANEDTEILFFVSLFSRPWVGLAT